MKGHLWKLLYPRWRTEARPPEPGLTLLVLIPGDLPVFLDIALSVCERQNCPALAETLVIPDIITPELKRRVEKRRASWPHGRLRLVPLAAKDRFLIRTLKNPHHNVWLQFFRGVEATATTHAVWHDADLFLIDSDLLRRQYAACSGQSLACLGVSPVWDPWFKQNGFGHITATWELTFDTGWARRFAPWQHHGHDATINGKRHAVDITLLPQALTPPQQVGMVEMVGGFVHFNYVICTYRWFQQSRGPYEDEQFRLLLVRLLIDAFDSGGYEYEVPPAPVLAKGLTDASQRVTYTRPATLAKYDEFRTKLQSLIESPLLTSGQSAAIARGVAPFDAALGWRSPSQGAMSNA